MNARLPRAHGDRSRWRALVADYDGTLSENGAVDGKTVLALEALKASGRKFIVVTGRRITDFRVQSPRTTLREESTSLFPEGRQLVDRFIAENGGVIWNPATDELWWPAGEERGFIELLPDGSYRIVPRFVQLLKRRGIPEDRLWVGKTVVATTIDHLDATRAAIAESGLDLRVDVNLDVAMVSPRRIDRVSALKRVFQELGIETTNAIAIGDAKYDLPFLRACGKSVAVASAEPAVKDAVQCVTTGGAGAGIQELIQELIS